QSLKRHRQALDYKQQKEALDAIHKADGTDVFVASYLIFTQKDASEYSMCVWTKGIDSLLPKTEHISFLIDKDAKEYVTQPWERAFPVVASLMEKEEGVLPERYRVRSFPTEEQIARLRAAN